MIIPYIVYGNIKLDDVLQTGATVTATNNTKGGNTSETTDANGHYEIDLSNMTNGYDAGDEIKITYSTCDVTFNVDSGFEIQRGFNVTSTINVGISITPHVHHYVFFDLDRFNIKSWKVSKSIIDALWKFSGELDGSTLPSVMKNFKVSMDDHNDVSRLIFVGIFPGANYAYQIAADKTNLEGYDHGWYLAAQKVPASIRVTAKTTNPADTIKTLLGTTAWMNTCGIDPNNGNITDVASWSSIQKQFEWKHNTKKQAIVDEITDYVDSIFHIKFKTIDSAFYPVAYFVANGDVDGSSGLDLPAQVTITSPDAYLINIKKESNESEMTNRVTVHGVNRETGLWKDSTTETAAVTDGDELPIEMIVDSYVVEPPPADAAALQTATDNKADELYALFYTNATTTIITAIFKKRADLELWQKIKFSGYSGITTDDLRIVAIEYSHSVADDVVTVQCIPLKDLSMDKARRMALKDDSISGMQNIFNDMFDEIPYNEVGEVTSISGSVATVTLEKDSKSIEARILNP